MTKFRHLPYYHEQKVEAGEIAVEDIMNDPIQGLGCAGRSGFIQVFNAETVDTYAEIQIFSMNNTSMPIPIYIGGSINYAYEDNVWMEWIKVTAIGGWVKYTVHATPGLHPELEAKGRSD